MLTKLSFNSPNFYVESLLIGQTKDGVDFKNTFVGSGGNSSRHKAFISAYSEIEERAALLPYENDGEHSKILNKLSKKDLYCPELWKPFLSDDETTHCYKNYERDLHSLEVTSAINMSNFRQEYVPSELLYFRKRDDSRGFFPNIDTTGAAAHTSLAKAAKAGALEVIEKNSLINFFLTKEAKDITRVISRAAEFKTITNLYSELGLSFTVIDITMSELFPCFLVVSKTESNLPYFGVGAGCNVNAVEACLHALKECLQLTHQYNQLSLLYKNRPRSINEPNGWKHSTSFLQLSNQKTFEEFFINLSIDSCLRHSSQGDDEQMFWQSVTNEFGEVFVYRYGLRDKSWLKFAKVLIPSLFWNLPSGEEISATNRKFFASLFKKLQVNNNLNPIPFP